MRLKNNFIKEDKESKAGRAIISHGVTHFNKFIKAVYARMQIQFLRACDCI